MSEQRRLGAIMFTDVVGYSAITERDERAALQLLKEHRAVLSGLFPRHSGTVIKTIGDAFLVEFASAVEAVECAVEAQSEMAKFNAGRREGEKVLVRIAIHVGDIVHSAGDILGDAVNVAARVQQFAEPGGVCVTRQVVDQVVGKVRCDFMSLGTRELKNIKSPVELFRVVSRKMSSPHTMSLDPHRVAVLPLANMSPDPNDGYFADGMTEELISTISKIRELSVISRTSVVRYKETTLSLGDIARELAAGTVLEGSIRKAGNRVRITAQLIRAETDEHLWSQSYDRELTDVFAIQGDIAERIADALKVELLSNEKERIEKKATESTEAYSLYLKGRYYWNERTEAAVRTSIKYFEEAAKADPRFAKAYTGLADAYLILSDYGWMNPPKSSELAEGYALKALELDDGLAEAHASLGLALSQRSWDFRGGERELRRALELKPNYATAYHWYATNLEFQGRAAEAYQMIRRARDLDPYSRVINMSAAVSLLYLRQYEKALEELEEVIESNPDFGAAYWWKSLVMVLLGRKEEAILAAKKCVELNLGAASSLENLAVVYSCVGEMALAMDALRQAQSIPGESVMSPTFEAILRFRNGEKDEAFRLFNAAVDVHDNALFYFRNCPGFEDFRADARWAGIEKRMFERAAIGS